MLLRFYIGADNATGKLAEDKIIELASIWYTGATLIPTIGVWENSREASCILEVQTDNKIDYAYNFIANACKVLQQDAIGLSVNGQELAFLS